MSAAPTPVLEFAVNEVAAARLFRAPALAGRRSGRIKSSAVTIVWHDTADLALAKRGLALSETSGVWSLEQLSPSSGIWLPAAPPPVLATGLSVNAVFQICAEPFPSGPLAPVAAFTGRQRSVLLQDAPRSEECPIVARASVLEGALRGVLHDSLVHRIILAGNDSAMAAVAAELGDTVPLIAPRASLAAEAQALARGVAPRPRRLGAPTVPPEATLGEAMTAIIAHLADVMLHWAGQIGSGEQPEPVHQMRVAVRRLRSALSVFRRAVDENAAWLDDLADALTQFGRLLGAARDWDVFLAETGAAVANAFPAEARVAAMLSAAGRKRAASYAALRGFLDDPSGWPRLALRLALLPHAQPWLAGGADMATPARDYARKALDRRLGHVLASGTALDKLPPQTLHETRKQAKRLRYTIEFFTPLFAEKAVRRYLRRLEKMQEAFGTLNDGAVATALTQDLSGAFAAGAVQGFVAAQGMSAARQVQKSWNKFCREEQFWD